MEKIAVRGALGDLDVDFVAFHGERIDVNSGVGNLDGASSGGIELPAMPRTDEFTIVDYTGSERTTSMRTNVAHGRKLTTDAGNTKLVTATPYLSYGPFRGHLAE